MNPSVTVANLTKVYGAAPALLDLSLEVQPGSIYGLIGPNGAGKTTALAILAGLIRPTSGSVRILGFPVCPGGGSIASRIGFFSGQFPFFDYLTGAELLLTCGLMHGLPARETQRRAGDLLDLFELGPAAGQYVAQYSQGMRNKLGLACALIHAPAVLILDEPFAGLDPASVYRLFSCFRRIAASGRTVVLSAHEMALVERLCSRVGVLHRGVLRREIVPGSGGIPGEGEASPADSRLESALWEIIGRPEVRVIPWLHGETGAL